MRKIEIWIIASIGLLLAVTLYANAYPLKPGNSSELPPVIEVPFELKGGLVFVKVKINGKPANFILDSGAPMLVLSPRLAVGATEELVGQGVSGSFAVQGLVVPEFEMGGMQQKKVPAIAVELAHLEKITKRPIDGLIGYSTLKDYEFLVDYKAKLLKLFKPGTTVYHRDIKPKDEMPFELQAHIPVIEATIGAQKMFFGLDTGAEANLLDLTSQLRLTERDYKKSKTGNISGANQHVVSAQEAHVNTTLVNGHNYRNMHFVFSDISHLNKGYGLSIDGLLGYPFLSSRKMSVNFKDKKVYFWD